MKIELDLTDILSDDYGSETLQESIRRQVIQSLTETVQKGIAKKIDHEVEKVINEEIKAAVAAQMPTIVEDLMSAEYTVVDCYGSRSTGPTTFRKELVKEVTTQLVYKKTQYSSDANAFTKAVDAVVASRVQEFKAEFDKQVNSQFVAEAMEYATAKLKQRLGVK
jgi:ribonuclease D